MQRQATPQLSTSLTLANGTVIKNRLFKSAMSEQLGDKAHNPTRELARLYAVWARGGIGLAVTGNVMVDRRALGEPQNVVLDEASDLSLFKKWARAGKRNDTQLWMQLNHPGKQIPKFLAPEPVAPSAISLGAGLENAFNTPRALSDAEILAIIAAFGRSALLAKQAGFTGVQIHGAHGYLVSQFLSPHHNRRTDRWGGTPENRMRFVLAVYREIRRSVGTDFPVGIKLNSADFMKSGFSAEASMAVAEQLEAEGIDLIEISGGTYESPSMMGHRVRSSTRKREAYFLDYAAQLRKAVDLPLVVTGGFRSGPAMRAALESGATDMIGLARPLAVAPGFPAKVIQDGAQACDLRDPTTGIAAVDKIFMLSITWYEYQLARIGNGKPVNPQQNAWLVVLRMIVGLGVHTFRKRRA